MFNRNSCAIRSFGGVIGGSAVMLLVAACAVETAENGEPAEAVDVPLEEVTEEYPAVTAGAEMTEKGCPIPRSDVVGYRTIGSGTWGSWQECYEFCPAGTYAYSVALRSEPTQGSGDDTAMNGIRLQCYNRSNGAYQGYITSHTGYWGNWLARVVTNPFAAGNPIVGGKMKIEPPQGSRTDDTAANAVQMKSRNGVWIQPDANTAWGSWNGETSCPSNSAVCGVKTRVEPTQGNGDDTALNGVALACCQF